MTSEGPITSTSESEGVNSVICIVTQLYSFFVALPSHPIYSVTQTTEDGSIELNDHEIPSKRSDLSDDHRRR